VLARVWGMLVAVVPCTALAQGGAAAGVPAAGDFDAGRIQYHRTCAQCHGRNLINSGNTVYDLRRFPPDQPERFFQSLTKGKGNMPSFEGALSPEQMRALWAYVMVHGEAPK